MPLREEVSKRWEPLQAPQSIVVNEGIQEIESEILIIERRFDNCDLAHRARRVARLPREVTFPLRTS